jgi:thiol:disulfide interchange protein
MIRISSRIAAGVVVFVLTVAVSFAQQGTTDAKEKKLYNPSADAAAELRDAVARAGREGKHVLVQVGGNWCSWCLKLHDTMTRSAAIDSLLRADFVVIRVNFSKENRNESTLAALGYPQRFGFPVLLVLDGSGKRLHTQDSGLLERDKAHDTELVYRFLHLWRPAAVRGGE